VGHYCDEIFFCYRFYAFRYYIDCLIIEIKMHEVVNFMIKFSDVKIHATTIK
jgi:hypothetical protein